LIELPRDPRDLVALDSDIGEHARAAAHQGVVGLALAPPAPEPRAKDAQRGGGGDAAPSPSQRADPCRRAASPGHKPPLQVDAIRRHQLRLGLFSLEGALGIHGVTSWYALDKTFSRQRQM
jgi:hypothetical protein